MGRVTDVCIPTLLVLSLFACTFAARGHRRERKPYSRSKTPIEIKRPRSSYVKFDCDIRGRPKPSISWYKDGKAINTNRMKMKRKTLLITDLKVTDSGEYACLGRNRHGMMKKTFTFKVTNRMLMAPLIDGPKNVTVKEGSAAVLYCNVISYDGDLTISWHHHYKVNGSYLDSSGSPYLKPVKGIRNSSNSNVLIINDVTTQEGGWYTCISSNDVGVSYKSAWLQVDVALVRTVGDRVTFQCPSEKTPVRWFKAAGDFKLNPLRGNRLKMEGKSLVIDNVKLTDAGEYICLGHDKMWKNFTLIVDQQKQAPNQGVPVIEGSKNTTVRVGESAVFTCKNTQGGRFPKITWLHNYQENGSYYSANGNPNVKVVQKRVNATSPDHYVVYEATEDMEGGYTCVVESSNGKVFKSAWLDVVRERTGFNSTGGACICHD